MDLSLYKDEAQLDKSSPRKRRRGVKSEEEEESDEDEDYEEHPKKKKIVKRPAAIKSPKMSMGKKISTVNDESTESDEENLMEIKKKAVKKQVKLELFLDRQRTLTFCLFRLRHPSLLSLKKLPNLLHQQAKLR